MQNRKVPELRFKEFAGEWEEKRLGELFEEIKEKVGNSAIETYSISAGKGFISQREKFGKDISGKQNKNYIVIKPNEFSYNKGNSKTYKYGCIYPNETQAFIAVPNVFISFKLIDNQMSVQYFAKIFENHYLDRGLRRIISSTARMDGLLNINKNYFFQLTVPVASILEQQKIALFLSKVDDKIEKTEKKKELWEHYKKGIMQKIFSQQIRFKDNNGNDYPDWEEKRLGKIADVRDGTHDSPKFYSKGYPLITSKNLLKNGKLNYNDISYIQEEDFININKRSRVDIGDILFGMIGTIGNPVIVDKDGFAIKNVALIKEQSLLLNCYLINYLKSHSINKQFHRLNTGNTQKFIALGVIRNLNINLPSLPEQQKIALFLSAIDEKIGFIAKELKALKEFKKGLLQKLLTGKVRVEI